MISIELLGIEHKPVKWTTKKTTGIGTIRSLDWLESLLKEVSFLFDV